MWIVRRAYVFALLSLTLLLSPASAAAQTPNPWIDTADMAIPQHHHSAVLLGDGTVLFPGGNPGADDSRTPSQLYHPTTGMWSYATPMNFPRDAYSATLLADGKVLVVGGTGQWNQPRERAEVYDPATATWSVVGAPSLHRADHTATLLADGRVLIAGGFGEEVGAGSWDATATADLYDPTTGLFTPTGRMHERRASAAAVLLPNGKVLVVDGWAGWGRGLPGTAELYNPATGTWTLTGSMSQLHQYHTATLLRTGKVLVVGGSTFGGFTNVAELYDPATGLFTRTANLLNARRAHTATLLGDGTVLAAGGLGPAEYAERYDPASGTWAPAGRLRVNRFMHTATLLLDGTVLLASGSTFDAALGSGSHTATSELYVGARRDPSGPLATISGARALCGGLSATLTAAATGGTAPYTFAWSGGPVGPSTVASTPGNYTVTVTDAAGRADTATRTVAADSLALAIGDAQAPGMPTTGGVSLAANVTGGSSPLAYAWTKNGVLFSNAPTITDSPGGDATYAATVTDGHGCSRTASFSVAVDAAPPTTSAVLDGTAGTNGWFRGAVLVTLFAVDSPGGTGVSATGYAIDDPNAGNPPTGDCASGPGFPFPPMPGFPPGDTCSPPPILPPGSFPPPPMTSLPAGFSTYSQPFWVTGAGGHTLTYLSLDQAGNLEPVRTVQVKIDQTGPTLGCARPGGAWHSNNVAIPCTAGDGLSGLTSPADASFALSTNVAAGTASASASTGARQVCDVAGNCATAGPIGGIKVDRQPPGITASAFPLSGGSGWSTADVTVSFACSDGVGGSGIASCFGPVTVTADGATTVDGTACDAAGNCASTGQVVKIDRTPPVIQIGVAVEASSYVNTVSPTVDVADALSGVDAAVTVVTVNGQQYVGGTPLTTADTHVLTVSAADRAGNAASRTVTFRVQHTSALTITGGASGDWNDPVTLEATLVDTGVTPAAPIGGQPVALQLGGASCPATTDPSGKASCVMVPNQAPATYARVATYAGSALHLPSAVTSTFETLKEATRLAMTSHDALPTGGVVVSARLTEDGGALPVVGRGVTFGAAGATATGTTNASGVATATLPNLPAGEYTLSAAFAGDGHYVGGNAAARTLLVYAPSQFVVWGGNPGGVRAGQRYYFWGSRWHEQVVAGAYAAGGSFQGYAAQLYGDAWSTGPGNSASPPATVASYVGVIVSTAIDKDGSTISGNVQRVVVLRVDDPSGYRPNPGHEASGVMVAGRD